MALTELVVLALATWRLTSLIHSEEGPYNVFDWLRHRLGVRFNPLSEMYASTEAAKAVLCPWCLSIWVGLAWALAWLIFPALAFWLALPFALSAASIWMHEGLSDTKG